MSFLSFSGLKKAYNSLGEEITRTFDSSQTEGGQATEVGSSSSPAPPQDAADTPDGEECATRGEEERGDEDWGQWEEQSKGRTTVVHTKTTTPLTSKSVSWICTFDLCACLVVCSPYTTHTHIHTHTTAVRERK